MTVLSTLLWSCRVCHLPKLFHLTFPGIDKEALTSARKSSGGSMVLFQIVIMTLSLAFNCLLSKQRWDQLQTDPSVSNRFELSKLPKMAASSALPLAPTAVICQATMLHCRYVTHSSASKRHKSPTASCCFAFSTFSDTRYSTKDFPGQPTNRFSISLQPHSARTVTEITSRNIIFLQGNAYHAYATGKSCVTSD